MRATRIVAGASVLMALALTLNCSKKAAAPTAPPATPPSCSLSASSLDFGNVPLGGSADRSLTISNAGGGTLTGSATSSVPDYAVVTGSSYSLTAGQQVVVLVRYTPTSLGLYSGAVTLSGTGCGSVSCTGAGMPTGPLCQLSTTSLDFGSLPPGVCGFSDRKFTVSNAGVGTLSGTVASLCPTFQIIGRSTYGLGQGMRDTFTVRFSPIVHGEQRCRVVTGCDTVYCVGRTEAVATCARLSVSSIDFGTVYVGQRVTRNVGLSAGANQFDLIWVSEDNPNFDGPPPERDVQPGDITTLPVHFTPQTEGSHSSWFQGQCMYGIGDGQYHAFGCIAVTGTAVAAPGTPQCQLSATQLNFGTVSVGGSADLALTVTNIGGGVLNGIAAPSGCPEFTVVEDPTVSLGPGQSATYTIRFRPTQSGHAYTCYSFFGHPYCQMVTLTGQGQ